MKDVEDIKEQMGRFAGRFAPSTIVHATVDVVNADDTVDVTLLSGGQIPSVRLKSVVKQGSKMVLIPALNSAVLIGAVENSDEYVIIAVDEITDIVIVIGTVRHTINAGGFLMQKGTITLLSALTKIIDAVKQIAVIYGNNPDYTKLLDAQADLNDLLN